MAKKINETGLDAEKKINHLIDILLVPTMKSLRKEYLKTQTEALNYYKLYRNIPERFFIDHKDNLFKINEKAFNSGTNSGSLRVLHTFLKAGWIEKPDINEIKQSLQVRFAMFSNLQAENNAREMADTTKKTVTWLLEKYKEVEENCREINTFIGMIAVALADAKKRSIWRSIVGGLAMIHTAVNAGEDYAATEADTKRDIGINKIWVTKNDTKVRDTHKAMHNVQVSNDAFFEVPTEEGGFDLMMYPGDPNGSLANIINCRCVKYYRVAK